MEQGVQGVLVKFCDVDNCVPLPQRSAKFLRQGSIQGLS